MASQDLFPPGPVLFPLHSATSGSDGALIFFPAFLWDFTSLWKGISPVSSSKTYGGEISGKSQIV